MVNLNSHDSAALIESLAETLWAIEQIKLLKSRYFQAVDEKDYGAIAALFTADAVVDFSGEPQHHVGHHGITEDEVDPHSWRVVGGTEAGRVIAAAVQDVMTVHQGHDPQIVITGSSTARGRWTLYDMLEFPDETMHGFGHYLVEYELHDGHWLISSLRLTRLRVAWTPTLP
jgi:hypothetical protein